MNSERSTSMTGDANSTSVSPETELQLIEDAGLPRFAESVRIGVPWPIGQLQEASNCIVVDAQGEPLPAQSMALDRWTDGSIRWSLVEFLANSPPHGTQRFQILKRESATSAHIRPDMLANQRAWRVELGTAGQTTIFELRPAHAGDQRAQEGSAWTSELIVFDSKGNSERGVISRIDTLESGPVARRWEIHGRFARSRLDFQIDLADFGAARRITCRVTICNRSRARHPGGFWELGDAGSVLIRGLHLEFRPVSNSSIKELQWNASPGAPLQRVALGDWRLHQESSGGLAWQCTNHLDRSGRVSLRYRGYRVTSNRSTVTGERASPCAVVRESADSQLGIALSQFWEKFPSALSVDESAIRCELLPRDCEAPHEIQGGERHSRDLWLAWGASPAEVAASLAVAHVPLQVSLSPEAIHRTGALWCFPAPTASDRPEFSRLMAEALEGPENLFWKREQIDEYGWRNFGDAWADHEQQYYDGPRPIISHYNNQYDLLYGLLIQYLRTRDHRWRELGESLARHLIDIDLYNTEHDKAAYNGGLFWHTSHYHDAGLCTHRSNARSMVGKKIPAGGGGPGGEHNYGLGLALYYWLTGDRSAAHAAQRMADWVVRMDDGAAHLLGVASDRPTGFASSTGNPLYHGPGRGAGNSLNALLNGWLLSRDSRYLAKAEELVRRTIHPADDLAARNLADGESRWSTHVYLQALCRLLDVVPENEWSPTFRDYAREALLHYARWIAAHDVCFLDRRAELEFPTETWPAQDFRKGNVLLHAARWTLGEERERFIARGQELLARAWSQLLEFDTRANTRPLALALQQGYIETYLNTTTLPLAPERSPIQAWEPPQSAAFCPQKHWLRQQLRSPRSWPSIILRMVQPRNWRHVWQRSWPAQRIRNWFGR